MINLNGIKVYAFYDKLRLKNLTYKRRNNNVYEIYRKNTELLKSIIIDKKDFFIELHIDQSHSMQKLQWHLITIAQKFFIENLEEFIVENQFVVDEFELGTFNNDMEDNFKQYINWSYFQFDKDLSVLFTLEEYCKLLNEYHIYQVMDRDWVETKIFTKTLTVEDFSRIFRILKELRTKNHEIITEMRKAKVQFFNNHKEEWLKEWTKK